MSTPFGRAWLHSKTPLALLATILLTIAGCSSSTSGSTSIIEITPAAMKSLPSVDSGGSTSIAAALTLDPAATGTIGDYFFVEQLFKLECRHPQWGGVNYCPPGTPDPPAGAFDPYQFTMQTLIGFIFHAQGYTELVTDCSGNGLTPKIVTASSYSAASTTGSPDPTRFVLNQFDSYTCRSSNVSSNSQTRMVSAVADSSYQATLHTRYKYDAGNGAQTDFFQVDISMDAGTPTFLAFNFASAEPFASRLVLLVNLVDHKFALKYYTPAQGTAPARYAVAVGLGGYDLTTGTPNAGHYYIDFLNEPMEGEQTACVNNAGGAIEVDVSNCTTDGVPMPPTTWTGSTDIQTYLAVPAADLTRLAPYLAVFETATTLTTADAWHADGDEDLYWPATLN